ncbi:MAG: hypothetical protein HQK53_12545 [Oligoflexia bacterium]|nr:hypothetical protein [Oligoflexia bacterium]
MSDKQKKFSRRNILPYPRFQLTLAGVNILITLAILEMVYFQIFQAYDYIRSMGVMSNLDSKHPYLKFVNLQQKYINDFILTACIISILLTLIINIYISFKLVGPMVRLSKYFEKMEKEKDITELHFREGDFFPNLPDQINRAISAILTEENIKKNSVKEEPNKNT